MHTEFTSQNLADLFQVMIVLLGAIFVSREICLSDRIESLKSELKEREDQLEKIRILYRASLNHIACPERPDYRDRQDSSIGSNVIHLNAWKADHFKPRRAKISEFGANCDKLRKK